MSTASSLGKLIKLKCLTGNHAKVKEMLCKLLLAPTFLGVWRRLSADVCGLDSGVAEQSWNVENWIVTVDFAACISVRKWTFNNSTIWGPGVCLVQESSQCLCHWDFFDYYLSSIHNIIYCIRCGVSEWCDVYNKVNHITQPSLSPDLQKPIKHICENPEHNQT